MQDRIMKIAAAYGSVFAVLISVVIVLYIENRDVLAESGGKVEGETVYSDISTQELEFIPLELQSKVDQSGFQILLPEDVEEGDYFFDYDPIEKIGTITVQSDSFEDFSGEEIFVNGNEVRAISVGETEKQRIYLIDFYHVYVCRCELINHILWIYIDEPSDVYEKIIIIDPGHGGMDNGQVVNGVSEKKLTLDIATRVENILESTGIFVYLTRDKDVEITEERRIEFANEVGADMFISIHTAIADSESVYGIFTEYNDRYYIPGLGNLELADCLEYSTVEMVNGKANGLFGINDETSLLSAVEIPGSVITVGYISNPMEAKLLKNDIYIQKVAEGICNGIIKAYEILDE